MTSLIALNSFAGSANTYPNSSYGNGYNRNSNNYNSNYNNRNSVGNNANRNNTHYGNGNNARSNGFFPLGSDIRDSRPASHPFNLAPGHDSHSENEIRLRTLANDPKLGKADRGWLQQETRRVDRNRRLYAVEEHSTMNTVRPPPGMDLTRNRVNAHEISRDDIPAGLQIR